MRKPHVMNFVCTRRRADAVYVELSCLDLGQLDLFKKLEIFSCMPEIPKIIGAPASLQHLAIIKKYTDGQNFERVARFYSIELSSTEYMV